MAEFYPAVTTNAGITLVTDLLVGEQIVFTKLVAGDGIYEEGDCERTNLQKITELRNQKQEFGFSDITRETDSCILLKTLLSNKELTEGYRMTEIGVYAKKQGEEGDGILYSLSVAKEADYFPRYNGLAAVEIIEEYYITISDAAEVVIQTGKGSVVLLEDLEKFKEEIRNHIDDVVNKKIVDLQNQIGVLANLITGDKGCLVDAINEIAEVIKPLTEDKVLTDDEIDAIIAGRYVEDIDWATKTDILADADVDAIIDGTYVDEPEDDEEDALTDDDIDTIIAGTYVDEPEDEESEVDTTEKEIDKIVENAFKENDNGMDNNETS